MICLYLLSWQFFASGLAQNGEDHQGFDGFLVPDIVEEVTRARKLVSLRYQLNMHIYVLKGLEGAPCHMLLFIATSALKCYI